MPRKGGFTLELIDATTKVPFKEHEGNNGVDAYAEVEPGVEYLMRLENHSNQEVACRMKVDGECLGYRTDFEVGSSAEELGLWLYNSHDGTSQHKALKVDKAVLRPTYLNTAGESSDNNEIGLVEVDVYEWILTGGHYYMNDDVKSAFAGSPTVNIMNSNGSTVNDAKKVLKSSPGKKQKMMNNDGRRPIDKPGKLIQTIKMKYCSTVGLIIAGVLRKPPALEWYKMTQPKVSSSRPKKAAALVIEPIQCKNETRDKDGNIINSKSYELFDLTNAAVVTSPDSEDEEEEE